MITGDILEMRFIGIPTSRFHTFWWVSDAELVPNGDVTRFDNLPFKFLILF
jgi:hypothetical protein